MWNNEQKRKSSRVYTITLDSLAVVVSFPCRLFAEYLLKGQMHRTKTIQVHSKICHYSFQETILWDPSQSKEGTLAVTVKLLSNKGLEFTAGVFRIGERDVIAHHPAINYKVSKSADIQVSCLCKFYFGQEEPAPLSDIQEEFQENSKIDQQPPLHQPQDKQYASSPPPNIKTSRLEPPVVLIEPPFSNLLGPSVFDFDRHSPSRKHFQPSPRNVRERLTFSSSSEGDRGYQLEHQLSLDRQLAHHKQLWEKQRDMLALLEQKYKQSLNSQEKLKLQLGRTELQAERKSQRVNELEEERIRLLRAEVDREKKLMMFRQTMRLYLQRLEDQIAKSFQNTNKRIPKQPLFRITKSSTRRGEAGNGEVGSQGEDGEEGDLKQSISYSKLAEDVSLSEIEDQDESQVEEGFATIKSTIVQQGIELEQEGRSEFMAELQRCCNLLSEHCLRISNGVRQEASSLSRHLARLNKSSHHFQDKLRANREHFQHNEESLFAHLEQLEEGLERELDLNCQKEQAILGHLTLIQDLHDRLAQLQEEKQRLEEERQFVKEELHDNNYLFALKEEEFITKIKHLEANLQLNFLQRGQQVTSDEDALQQCSQRLRDKQIELAAERKEKQRILQLLDRRDQELRQLHLDFRKLELSTQIRNNFQSGTLSRSFDEPEAKEEEPQKESYVEEELLKILT